MFVASSAHNPGFTVMCTPLPQYDHTVDKSLRSTRAGTACFLFCLVCVLLAVPTSATRRLHFQARSGHDSSRKRDSPSLFPRRIKRIRPFSAPRSV